MKISPIITILIALTLNLARADLSEIPPAPISKSTKGPLTINIVAGAPLTAPSLGDKTGGFGDVVSNLVMAGYFRDMGFNVNLIITSEEARRNEHVSTTLEIMKIVVPEIDVSKRNAEQVIDGIKFFVIDHSIDKALFPFKNSAEDINYLQRVLPRADVSLQYSANNSTQRTILGINSQFGIGFFEPDADEELLRLKARDEGLNYLFRVGTGAKTSGFYLAAKPKDFERTIDQWLTEQGQGPLSPGTKIAAAYSKSAEAMQHYIEALKISSRLNTGKWIFFARHFAEVDYSSLPKNVQVIVLKDPPQRLIEAAIGASHISPLVTGDVSLSTAMSTIRPDKIFVYEAPTWKWPSSDAIENAVLQKSDPSIRTHVQNWLSSMTIKFSPEQPLVSDQQSITQLAQFLDSKLAQNTIYKGLQPSLNNWSLARNTLTLYSVLNEFRKELHWMPKDILDGISQIRLKTKGKKEAADLALKIVRGQKVRGINPMAAAVTAFLYSRELPRDARLSIVNILSVDINQHLMGFLSNSKPTLFKQLFNSPVKMYSTNAGDLVSRLQEHFFGVSTVKCGEVLDNR